MMENPYLLMTPTEAVRINDHLANHNAESDLLARTFEQRTKATKHYIKSVGIEIPGHGEAGGYEHNRHKQNYIHLNDAGVLWVISRDRIYFDFIKDMLLQYAQLYPTLTLNTSKDTNPPGRLFHQTLNENMWLMYASLAYACIKADLTESERALIENDLFREMAAMFTDTYAHDFDIIHNHGLWAVAGVGVCGLALGDEQMAGKAIFGLKGDSESGGFLAQLKYLFSPDGYYMEGPYYHRFAIRPLLILAEAISRKMPELDIFHYSNSVIQRTTEALMATAYPDGTFQALNDSSKTIGITDEGLIVAASLCYRHYGENPKLLAMAQLQNEVWLADSSIALSIAANTDHIPLNWGSLTLNDGPAGDKGGLGMLRADYQGDIHMASLWYGQHGSDHTLHAALDHGHFDGLHLSWFNRGQEILKDYGYGRWVNVEPKFGGRYIPENKSYCKQTIAHNTVTVDQQSQNQGDTATAEQHWGSLELFDSTPSFGQIMSARADDYFPGVDMQRTVLLINRPSGSPLLVDLFELNSEQNHQYDYPVHYDGQITYTNFEYTANERLEPVGTHAGYQHLWQIAQSQTTLPESASASWLMGNSYYSMTTATGPDTQFLFAKIGANDPNFNLRNEPAFIVRDTGKNHLFASVFEQHGYFNESFEQSEQARGSVSNVRVLLQSAEAIIVEVTEASLGRCLICLWKAEQPQGPHKISLGQQTVEWSGQFACLRETD